MVNLRKVLAVVPEAVMTSLESLKKNSFRFKWIETNKYSLGSSIAAVVFSPAYFSLGIVFAACPYSKPTESKSSIPDDCKQDTNVNKNILGRFSKVGSGFLESLSELGSVTIGEAKKRYSESKLEAVISLVNAVSRLAIIVIVTVMAYPYCFNIVSFTLGLAIGDKLLDYMEIKWSSSEIEPQVSSKV